MEMDPKNEPSETGDNGPAGRKPNGQFDHGNRAAKGNPNSRRTAAFRRELYRSVSRKDFREVVTVLVTEAKAGESWAVKELFDRILGKVRGTAEMLEDEISDEEIRTNIEATLNRLVERRIAARQATASDPNSNGEANGHYPTK